MSPKLTIQLYTQTGEIIKSVELNPAVFGVKVKESVVHQAVVAQMANARQVLAHTKDRSEVRGGGRKPWRQKGTGRARHGSIRSPLWVGGGVTFGPTKDRNFAKKINKKMKRKALFMCLSDKVKNLKDPSLVLLDKLELEQGKTQEFVDVIRSLKGVLKLKELKKSVELHGGVNKKQGAAQEKDDKESTKNKDEKKDKKFDIKNYKLSFLVVLAKSDHKVIQAGRNLAGIKFLNANSLNVVDLLKYEKILMTEDALKVIEKIYLKA